MPSVVLNIVRKEEEGFDSPYGEDTEIFVLPMDTTLHAQIIEGGMESGKSSVFLFVEFPALDGSQHMQGIVIQTSLAALSGITIAGRAAFEWEFDGGPLAVEDEPDE